MSEIPRQVLSEALQQSIRSRTVRAGVFLTFRFDPQFFEEEILPIVFDLPSSQVPELRLLQLEDVLRGGVDLAVYYDKQALESHQKPARLDVERIGVSVPNGYFHPKVLLLLVDSAADDTHPSQEPGPQEGSQSLIVMAGSTNLTRAGWWENVEGVHFEEVEEGARCSFRGALLKLVDRVLRVSRQRPVTALSKIRSFITKLDPNEPQTSGGRMLPRFYPGGEPFVEFLRENLPTDVKRMRLEIVSPYFDEQENATPLPLASLLDFIRPVETRIFLPRDPAGAATCSEGYHRVVAEAGAQWSELPKDLLKMSQDATRRVHAKVYRFTNAPWSNRAVVFIGSVNFTNAGFNGKQNFESGFLVEIETRRPDWWLSVAAKSLPMFQPESESETLALGRGWRLTIRCRWESNGVSANCFWDEASSSPPLRLSAQGVLLFSLEPLPPRECVALPQDQSSRLAELLRSSSFVKVEIDGEESADILIEEERMSEYKPSVITTFTSADILRWWSLLTPEQKTRFLEQHAELSSDETVLLWLGNREDNEVPDKLFSAFAESFHSFGNQTRVIRKAIEAGRVKEATSKLFGNKFDSVRNLLERIIVKETDGDLVVRYVQALCAKQLMAELTSEQPEFFAGLKEQSGELESLIRTGTDLRDQFSFGDAAEREAFCGWFERWFVQMARPAEEAC